MTNPVQRNPSIDILKGIAMVMVILVHSRQLIKGLSPIFDIFVYGQLGCQIFFLASGYLTMASFAYKKPAVQSFYKRRFISIASGYYMVMALTFVLNTVTYRFFDMSIGFAENRSLISIFCNLIFIHGLLPFCNNNVVAGGWYIGTIMLIYMIFPLIYRLLVRVKHAHAIVITVMLVSWTTAVILKHMGMDDVYKNNHFYYFSVLVQLPCFLYGCIMYLEQDSGKEKKSDGIIGTMLVAMSLGCYNYADRNGFEFLYIPMPGVFSIGIYYICRNMGLNGKETSKNLVNTILMSLGKNSYYIYLAHPFFVWTMPKFILKFLEKNGMTINSDTIYVIMLPFMFILSYGMGMIFKKCCGKLNYRRL